MSQTSSDAQFGWFINDAPDRRTVAEIQRKVTKQSKRNAVSRIVQARNDKDTIAAWKLELGRILQVFNVRSVIFTWPSLTAPFQTELAMNTHVTVSDIQHDVSRIREVIGGQVHSVSAILRPSTAECSPPPRLKQGWLS